MIQKILLFLCLIILSIILFIKFLDYKKYHVSYQPAIAISNKIDIDYYDVSYLKEYYENIVELNQFARQTWVEEGIDVKLLSSNRENKYAATFFKNKYAKILLYEKKLQYAQSLKSEGYSNKDIEKIISKGIDKEIYKLLQSVQETTLIKNGATGKSVWAIQKKLVAKNYEINADGIYDLHTLEAVKEFQNKHNLFPSGEIDLETLIQLNK